MKKARSVLALILVCLLVFCSCGQPVSNTGSGSAQSAGSSAPKEPGENSVVTMAVSGSWDSLCPLASTTVISDGVCNTIFENLVEADGQGGYTGRLVESYEMADENTAMVFHLRQNAVWHDGQPFNADDVMYSVGLYTDGSYTSSRRLFFQPVEGCTDSGVEESENSAHVEKIDDYTVKFYFKSPMSVEAVLFPATTFFVFPEHLLKDTDPAKILESDFWVDPIGTGPFTYESTVPGESLTVKAFDDYYLGRPKFDKLVVKLVAPANVVTALMAKEIDIVSGSLATLNDADFDLAASIEGYHVEAMEGTSSHYLVLNSDVFTTPKIRKALAMMLDKDTMIQAGCNGRGTPVYTNYPPKNIYYNQSVIDELGYEFDPDAAYQMLVEEGFDFDRTYTVCINDLAVRQAMMTVMQETWSKYGMKLEIKTLDTQTCIAEMRAGNCDMWVNGGSEANFSGLVTYFRDWVTINDDGTYAPFNLARVDDPTLMNLEKELASATEEEDLRRITSEIQRVLLTDYDYVWLIGPYLNFAISDRVTGIDEMQMLSQTFNYYDWEIVG